MKNLIIIYAFISLFLFIFMLKWIDYLVINKYIKENFEINGSYKPPVQEVKDNTKGINENGKLTTAFTPNYSKLTSDVSENSETFKKEFSETPQYFRGVDTWRDTFDYGMALYIKRHNGTNNYARNKFTTKFNTQFMPKYQQRKTISGEFDDDGPIAANDYYI